MTKRQLDGHDLEGLAMLPRIRVRPAVGKSREVKRGQVETVEMGGDVKAELQAYSEKHRVQDLLEALTSHLLYEQPADPVASLIDLLQQMRSGASGSLLGSDDFASCFDTLDATGEGFISLEQVAKGIQLLGGSPPPGDLEQRFPSGEASKNAFVLYMREVFAQRWAGAQEE